MGSFRTVCTLLVPGFGLVTCEVEYVVDGGDVPRYAVLCAAVDEEGKRLDPQMWRRVERLLGAR